MARPRCRNPLGGSVAPSDGDELSGATAPGNAAPSETDSSGSSTPGSPAPAPAPDPTPAPGPTPAPSSTEEPFKLFMQTYTDTVKNQVQAPVPPAPVEPRERPLKARYPDLYSGKSRLDCYRFCQQCENHFDAARATGDNRTSFAASFLRDGISFRWDQYKKRHALEKGSDVPIPWEEFKAFLERNQRKTRA